MPTYGCDVPIIPSFHTFDTKATQCFIITVIEIFYIELILCVFVIGLQLKFVNSCSVSHLCLFKS
jgi:hypothetical protein